MSVPNNQRVVLLLTSPQQQWQQAACPDGNLNLGVILDEEEEDQFDEDDLHRLADGHKRPRLASLSAASSEDCGSGCTSGDSTNTTTSTGLGTHSTSSLCLDALSCYSSAEEGILDLASPEDGTLDEVDWSDVDLTNMRLSAAQHHNSNSVIHGECITITPLMEDIFDEFPQTLPERLACSEEDIAPPTTTSTHTNSTDNNSANNDMVVQKRKRLRFPKQIYNPVYRVLKADMRRQYGLILNRCVNSGDVQRMRDFYLEFATEDVQYQSIAKPPDFNIPGLPVFPPLIQLTGRQQCWTYYAAIMNTIPDFTATMSNVQIRTRSGTEALQIEYDVSNEATLVTAMLRRHMKPPSTASSAASRMDSKRRLLSTSTSTSAPKKSTSVNTSTSSNSAEIEAEDVVALHDIVLLQNGEFNLPFGVVGRIKADKRRSTHLHQIVQTKETIKFRLEGKAIMFIDANKKLSGMQVAVTKYHVDI